VNEFKETEYLPLPLSNSPIVFPTASEVGQVVKIKEKPLSEKYLSLSFQQQPPSQPVVDGDADQLGDELGLTDGFAEGLADGVAEGDDEGLTDGFAEGLADGVAEGDGEGLSDGLAEGPADGLKDGASVGGTTLISMLPSTIEISIDPAAPPDRLLIAVRNGE
jgi:flagellar biosynthesis/type III secretory pathway protein FliH